MPDPTFSTPRHLTRWLARYWLAALATEAEYRANFVLAAVMSLIGLAGSLFTLSVLYQNDHQLGGWSWPEAMMVVAVYTMLDGVQQTLLAPNHQAISELVRQGTLDFALLKPLDSQAHLSLRKLSIWGLPNLTFGLVLIGYAGARTEPAAGLLDYATGLLPLAFAVVILYALGFLLATTTIWLTKTDNITIAMQALLESARFPIPAYAPAFRAVFTFVVPAAFMTTVPAQAIVRDTPPATQWTWIATSAAVACALLLASRAFWQRALASYTSASS